MHGQGTTDLGWSPIPYLDHVVIMLDGEAYRDVLASEFLRKEFARFKVKRASSTLADAYTSAGVAGINTLMEFFDVAAPPVPGVRGGLVFSFEVQGSLKEARRRLEARAITELKCELVHRAVEGEVEKKPWYNLVRPDMGEGSPFLMMLGEVTPDYFDRIGARRGPNGELYRKGYLDAALGFGVSPQQCLRDVTEVTVRLCEDRVRRVSQTLEALGTTVKPESDGLVLKGPDLTLRLVPARSDPEGILSIRMALARRGEGHSSHCFGKTSTLTFEEGGTALWTFTPPQPKA